MTNRSRFLSFAALLAWVPGTFAQPVLRYDEAADRVTIYRGEAATVHQYDAARRGFVGPDGSVVSWVDATGQWQLKGPSGVLANFGADGRVLAPAPAKPRGYHPLDDVGDTGGGGQTDLQPAWKYLESRDQAVPDVASPMSGDDGGGAATFDSVGGNAAAREKDMREKWQAQKGAHQGDSESAMETGKPSDPLGKLRDTLKQAATAVRDIRQTAEEIDNIDDELKGSTTGLFDSDDDDVPPAAPGGAAGGAAGSPAASALQGAPPAGPAGAAAPAGGTTYADPASMLGGGAVQDTVSKPVQPDGKVFADPADAFGADGN